MDETTQRAYDWITGSDTLLRLVRDLTATWRDRATEEQRVGFPWALIVTDQLMERVAGKLLYARDRGREADFPITYREYVHRVDWAAIVKKITDDDARDATLRPVAYLS